MHTPRFLLATFHECASTLKSEKNPCSPRRWRRLPDREVFFFASLPSLLVFLQHPFKSLGETCHSLRLIMAERKNSRLSQAGAKMSFFGDAQKNARSSHPQLKPSASKDSMFNRSSRGDFSSSVCEMGRSQRLWESRVRSREVQTRLAIVAANLPMSVTYGLISS